MIPICHVQVLPILSGAQRAMLDIFRHLDRDRIQPHVICQQPGPLSEELARWTIPCHFVPSLVRPIHPWRDAQAYRELFRLFRRHRFQLVHTHSSKPGVLGRVAARRARVPWVVHHVHGFAFHDRTPRPLRWFYSTLEKLAGVHCDRVIFCNHEERALAIRTGILPSEKCLTVHNGVELSAYTPEARAHARDEFRRRHGIGPETRAILFMGRLDTQKQPLILPAIARHLDQRQPRCDWQLIVAGAGPLESELKSEVARAGMGDRIRLIGWQTAPTQAIHGCDLFLQPSLWEGLPISTIEAHAAGLPTVASDVKGVREVVTCETGILCPPSDACSYANALAALLDSPKLRGQMGSAGQLRASRHFDGTVNMQRIASLYAECFNGLTATHRAGSLAAKRFPAKRLSLSPTGRT